MPRSQAGRPITGPNIFQVEYRQFQHSSSLQEYIIIVLRNTPPPHPCTISLTMSDMVALNKGWMGTKMQRNVAETQGKTRG
ncbi:hypothetical protein FHR23_003253 [Stakelama sediminis]|uniref:Uncharacterized protein n=1 Tax=Stakelama sediminis TaxID=463200 RepID=A0A840Z3J0_9SPHN|nr:hypothetical protein [Stakelama sediminis]